MHACYPSLVLSINSYVFLSLSLVFSTFFFFNDTATTEIYTLSLHDALPIFGRLHPVRRARGAAAGRAARQCQAYEKSRRRSEEHTSELQSRENLVCRLLLEKKKKKTKQKLKTQYEDYPNKLVLVNLLYVIHT